MSLTLCKAIMSVGDVVRRKRIVSNILLAHEMDLVTQGARHVLETRPDWKVVAECHVLSDSLKQLQNLSIDIVICSEQLDPAYDTFRLVERLRNAAPNARLILIGAAMDGRLIRDLFHMGLYAYLHRGDPLCDGLPAAIQSVLRNSLYLSPTANAEYLVAMRPGSYQWQMDEESRAVLRLLAAGYTVGNIAAQMKVSTRHIYWICQKLRYRFGATTNAHMISCAIAEGYATALE